MRLKKHDVDPKITRLKSCDLFAGFTDDELEAIAELADEIDVGADYALTRQGDPARQAFVIINGTCRVEVDGKRMATLGPGDMVGEMGLIDLSRRSASVTTETPAHLLVLDPRSFMAFVEREGLQRKVMRQLAERVRRTDELHAGSA